MSIPPFNLFGSGLPVFLFDAPVEGWQVLRQSPLSIMREAVEKHNAFYRRPDIRFPLPAECYTLFLSKGTDVCYLKSAVDEEAKSFAQSLAQKYVCFALDGDNPGRLLASCIKPGCTVSCAESCTGGMIAHLITLTPGSSAYFRGGVVSYSPDVKVSALGVSESDIKENGVVSEAVARQMALGACSRLGSTYSVSTTGVAGPGADDAPLGTVWVSVSNGRETVASRLCLSGSREKIIEKAAKIALLLLCHFIRDGSGLDKEENAEEDVEVENADDEAIEGNAGEDADDVNAGDEPKEENADKADKEAKTKKK